MRRLLGSLGAFAVFVACGAGDDGTGAEPLPTGTAKHDTSGTDAGHTTALTDASTTPPIAPPVDAGGGGSATTYIGTLDATPASEFGGSPYCKYNVTLKNVSIEISALPSGEVIDATVKDTMVESTVPPCTLGAAPPADQSFSFTTFTQLPDGYELAFQGAAGNKPATKLVVDIKKVGSSYQASPSWHRTDQPLILDWTVMTSITLGPK